MTELISLIPEGTSVAAVLLVVWWNQKRSADQQDRYLRAAEARDKAFVEALRERDTALKEVTAEHKRAVEGLAEKLDRLVESSIRTEAVIAQALGSLVTTRGATVAPTEKGGG